MSLWMRLALCLLLVGLTRASDAAFLQYRLSTGEITGVNDQAIAPVPDYGVASIPEPVSSIVWPPPAGCVAGQWDWTRITDAGAVTVSGGGMAPRTDLLWFSTSSPLLPNCVLVSTWPELRAVVDQTLTATLAEYDTVLALNALNVATFVLCPGQTGGAPCTSARADMATLNNAYPSTTALATLLSEILDLVLDARDLKLAQGW